MINNTESFIDVQSGLENPFVGLMEHKPAKLISLTIAFLSIPLNVALLYAIIWYERYGTDNRRTIMNKLVASQCWNLIFFTLFCQPLEYVSYFTGSLPQSLCFLNVILKNSTKTQILLFFDSTMIVQYLLIFWIKNPAAVNDEFWSIFITIWIVGLSQLFNFSKFYIGHRQPLNFYVCSGFLPSGNWSLPSHFGAHFEVLTILTVLFVKLKIHFYKTKAIERKMTKRSIFLKNFTLEAMNKSSLTTFTINLAGLLMFSSFVFLGMRLNKHHPLEMNEYPYYLFYYALHIVMPNLVCLIFCSLFFIKNSTLRKCVFMELRNYISLIERPIFRVKV